MKSRAKFIIMDIIIVFIAITAISTVLLNLKFIQTLDGDNAPQTYAIFSMVGKALHNGELPLWNPYIWGGVSNVGSPITEAFYPINWLLCYLFYDGNTGVASYAIITVNLIFHISLYYCGCYFLLKEIGTKRIYAAMLALLSISCFPFAMYLTWIVYVDSFCWFPFIILSAIRLINACGRKRIFLNTAVLGILFAIEAHISVSVMLVLSAFFVTMLFAVKIVLDREDRLIQCLKLVCSGMIGIMLSMPVIVETAYFVTRCARYIDDGFIYGLTKLSFESFMAHKVSFEDAESIISALPVRSWLSIGGILFILCMIGVFRKTEKQFVHRWSIIGVVFCLLYCFGYIVTDFVYYIPFLNCLRETFMYGGMTNFFVTVLAGHGINAVLDISEKETLKSKLYFGNLIVGVMFVCLVYNMLPHKYVSVYKILLTILLVAVLAMLNFKRASKKAARYMICITAMLSIYVFCGYFGASNINEIQAIKQIKEVNDYNSQGFSSFVREDNARIIQVSNAAYPSNQGIALGIKEDNNYFNPATELAIKCNANISFSKRSQLHNVKYWLINSNNDESFISWWENAWPDIPYSGKDVSLYTSWDSMEASNIKIYESDITLGPAWCVSTLDYYDGNDEDGIFAWINDEQTHLDKIVKINQNRLSPSMIARLNDIDAGNGEYSINEIDYRHNKISYHVASEKDAVLVTAELYDKGWKVYVNGKRENLLNVDYSNRAVIIPKGDSVVEFIYRPNGFLIGSAVQLITLLSLMSCWIYVAGKEKDSGELERTIRKM